MMSFRHAFRSLRRSPVFSATVVLSLLLGIGAAGTMFALVHHVLIAPLRYGQPERLVDLALLTPDGRSLRVPPALAALWRGESSRVAAIGIYRTGNANLQLEGNAAATERVTATWVSASLLPLLEVAPLLGRSFTSDEERAGNPNAVVLAESTWRNRYGASPAVLGKTLWVNSVPRVIVGVMPAGFAFPNADTRLWLPARPEHPDSVGEFSYDAIARLAPGVTAVEAEEDLRAALARLPERFPRTDSGTATADWLAEVQPRPRVRSLHEVLTADIAGTLVLLAAAAGLVLLVAWANLGNLVLIRSDARQRELAVRAALGAGRWRRASPLVGEAILLCAGGGAAALGFVATSLRLFEAYGPRNFPRLDELGLGPSEVAFVVLLAVLSVVVHGLVPALQPGGSDLGARLADGGRAHTVGQPRQRTRFGIAGVQVALALVATLSSVALFRTAERLAAVERGFDPEGVITLRTQLPFARYGEAAGVTFYTRLAEQAALLPGVVAAGTGMTVPLARGEELTLSVRKDGSTRTQRLAVNIVDAGYFRTLGIPLLAGHGFRDGAADSGRDVVLSAAAAALLFDGAGGNAAIGRQLTLDPDGPSCTVVGVVGDVRDQDLAAEPTALLYRPNVVAADPLREPAARRTMALLVKSPLTPDTVVAQLRKIVADLDPAVPVFAVATMNEVERASTARRTLALVLVAAAAATTLLLGAIGLYGVVSCNVALRRREFGIRLALGSDHAAILRAVLRQGVTLAAAGGGAGLLVYVALVAPFLRSFLYGVAATDPSILVTAILLLGVAALAATVAPARRAARTDPVEMLRAD